MMERVTKFRRIGSGSLADPRLCSGVRVLALAAEAFGGHGGIAQSTTDLITSLSQFAFTEEIAVLPRKQGEIFYRPPHGVRQFPALGARLQYSLRAIELTLKIKPGIVYCGHVFMSPLARLCASLVGARLVSHVHGLEVWQPLSPTKRRALGTSDLILCVSSHTAQKVMEITGIEAERCRIIYNTIGERFTPGDPAAARGRFSLPQDAVIMSTVSRLDSRQRHKGHDRIIPLLRDLAKDFPRILYLVGGIGDDRARLEALANETDAADLVKFLGFVSDEDLPDLYRASDLYVMPSHGEGFGIAFVEAMACGTPALGLDIGGAGDALRDGELGIAVSEAEFPDALRSALSDIPLGREGLSSRTLEIFGKPRFSARLQEAMLTLLQETTVPGKAHCE